MTDSQRIDLPGLVRLIELDRLLARSHGVTVYELAERFEISTKTARRDLDLCRVIYGRRLAVQEEDFGRKRYRIDAANRMFSAWVAGRARRLAKGGAP